MEMQKFDRTRNRVFILMLVFFVTSVTVASCLSPLPSVKNKFTDIAYATKSKTQKLDIYMPNEGRVLFLRLYHFMAGDFMKAIRVDNIRLLCFRA